jgi:MHS family proline/betaine transporter-like MFS transporter
MRKILVSSMIGNALEWYDFVLYVQFSTIISKLFFPSEDPFTSLLATFGVFAVGFVMRPIGGVLFGMLGDKFGRKSALVFSILMMAIPTALIGFLPTYEQIGIAAPICLTIIRLLQGLALGGGFSGCMTFLVEHAPSHQRGLIGSSSMFSLGAGVFLGILVSLSFCACLSSEDFISWGWRLPFIISLAIGMVAFYIRDHVNESPIYLKAKEHGNLSKAPVSEVFRNHWKELLIAIGIYITVTVPFYTFTAFFSTYLQQHAGVHLNTALLINAISIVVFMLFIPISGYLSDKYGRKIVLISTSIMIAIVTYPVFLLMLKGGFVFPLIGQIIFGIALGLYMGPVPATLVELFPTNIRFTGLALSYNFSAALLGGTAPFVYLKLIGVTGSLMAPAFYIIAFVVLTGFALKAYKDNYKEKLAEK